MEPRRRTPSIYGWKRRRLYLALTDEEWEIFDREASWLKWTDSRLASLALVELVDRLRRVGPADVGRSAQAPFDKGLSQVSSR